MNQSSINTGATNRFNLNSNNGNYSKTAKKMIEYATPKDTGNYDNNNNNNKNGNETWSFGTTLIGFGLALAAGYGAYYYYQNYYKKSKIDSNYPMVYIGKPKNHKSLIQHWRVLYVDVLFELLFDESNNQCLFRTRRIKLDSNTRDITKTHFFVEVGNCDKRLIWSHDKGCSIIGNNSQYSYVLNDCQKFATDLVSEMCGKYVTRAANIVALQGSQVEDNYNISKLERIKCEITKQTIEHNMAKYDAKIGKESRNIFYKSLEIDKYQRDHWYPRMPNNKKNTST